jgi:surface polysaccharide O-acyltransferase-like enzyme
MDNINKNNRLLWVDITRIIAVIAVVAIHVNSGFVVAWNKISWADWWVSNVYSGSIRFAVPIFVILSGYLLLDKQECERAFYSKRFYKVIIPLVGWSIIYMIFKSNYDIFSIFTQDFIKQFLSESVYYHLYFLYIIAELYIITPLLRNILAKVDMRDVYYYLILWFIFTPLVGLFGMFGYHTLFTLEAATGFLGFYIFGYAVKKTQITDKMIYLSALLVASSIIVTIIGTYILTNNSGQFDDSFIGWNSITTVTYSACLFILLRETFSRISLTGLWPKWESIISVISGTTMGIYLIHPILLCFISTGGSETSLLSVNMLGPIISVPLVTFLLVFSSLFVVLILQKIPLIRMIVP